MPPRHRKLTSSLASLIRLAPGGTVSAAACSITVATVGLLIPTVLVDVLDEVLAGGHTERSLLLLAGLLTVSALGEALGGLARTAVITRVEARLRYRFLRHVMTLGVGGQRQRETGDLVARVTGNISRAADSLPVLIGAGISTAASIGGIVALALLDWILAVVFVLGMVPMTVALRLLIRRMSSQYGQYLKRAAEIANRLADAVAGSRTIRACGTTGREITRVLAPLPALAEAGHRIWQVQRRNSWQMQVMFGSLQVAVLAAAVVGIAGGRLSSSEIVAAGLYLRYALGIANEMGGLIQLGSSRANAERVFEVLADRPPVAAGTGGVQRIERLPPGPGALSFRQVSVGHRGRAVLSGITLDIPPGAAVALVGQSGAGKTTLAQLAGGLREPDSGTVVLDGASIATLDKTLLHREISYAFDRPVLLGATIRDALTYGIEDAPAEQVDWALRTARADGFVQRLPKGLDTPLAEAPFSGGELQRLGLARALVRAGRVVVLDDATSSLDTVTEAEIARTLTSGLAGRTRILVAHRVTTAARADLVVWLEAGRIRSVAPHQVLWHTDPDYRAVFSSESSTDGAAQAAGEPDELAPDGRAA